MSEEWDWLLGCIKELFIFFCECELELDAGVRLVSGEVLVRKKGLDLGVAERVSA